MKINMSEFAWGFNSFSSGKRKKATKVSRKEQITSCKIFVEDKITGLKEEIFIPEGHYSKKEMQKLRNEALEKMVIHLLKKRK